MNLTEFADSIALILGRPFDHMLKENIKVSFIGKRALFLTRDPNAKGKFPEAAIQDLGCLELIEVDASECCEELAGCKAYRTKDKIPETVRYEGKQGYIYLGTINNRQRFDWLHPDAIPYNAYRRVKRPIPIYTIVNNYPYLFDYDGKYIKVRDIFTDPREAFEFSHCKDAKCGDMEDFPIPADLAELIKTELRNENGVVNHETKTGIEANGLQSQ